ncbi:Serine/threonine-protein kinase RUNKEL [Zea mays]|uniref:Serine/threonine-protein kinase RUNKEL n=1 Tax=Zea mays TaxID=4577 RepID=A0A1D6EXG4_MAIZE|nr:Serine/threonine-protein kinase RUNKEL [Zea mays]
MWNFSKLAFWTNGNSDSAIITNSDNYLLFTYKFTQEILKATYENCKVLLRSDLIKSSSEERSLLKNLGSWLGKFTIGRNQALRAIRRLIQNLLSWRCTIHFNVNNQMTNTVTSMNRYILSLSDDKQLVLGLISLIEQGTDVLRVKALLFVALLCKNSRRWLPHFFCNAKLISVVDRLGKEKEGFIHHCTEAFVQLVASLVPGILDTVSSDIQQVMVGKRHGPVTALAGRAHPKSTIHMFPVILHLLGSASFKHRVVTGHVLLQLANLIKILEAPFQVLFKNLTVDIKDVKPTSLLKDRLREVEGNPDFSNKDVTASQTPVVAEVPSGTIPSLTHMEQQPEINITSRAMSLPNILNQYAAPVRLPTNSTVEDDKVALMMPEQVPSLTQLMATIPREEIRFKINPKLGSLGPQLQYSKIMDLALDKANREIIHRQGSSSLTSATWSW